MNRELQTLLGAALAASAAAGPALAAGTDAPWDDMRRYVFTQSAQSFRFQESALTLETVASTLYFAQGQFGLVSNDDFAAHWSAGARNFATVTPYAVLHTLNDGNEIVLGLANPRVRGAVITYDTTVISGAPPARGGPCALFIDPSRSAPAPTATPTTDNSAQKTPINQRDRAARETIARFKAKDPGLNRFFETAAGWAVFPTIAKGALIVGGARGDGVVYAQDEVIGYSTLSQGTVGLQIGGQSYSEIIFFEHEAALNHFKSGNAEFSAQASAVAVTAGASANARYAEGVAVFTMAKGGAMLEASIGGQGFSFQPR